MNNHVAYVDRAKPRRKRRKRRMLTIPYEPVTGDALVYGGRIRKMRIEAGFTSQEAFALACGWCQAAQCKYEQPGRNTIKIENIQKMIIVINGGQ